MAVATMTCSRVADPSGNIDWKKFRMAKDSKYLELVSDLVLEHAAQCFPLNHPPGSVLRIAALEDTIYRDKRDKVNAWDKFYLPKIVKMQVLGILEGVSCSSDELVLMTCEDRKLYAYDGEELHVVALGLDQLERKRIEYPSDVTYYNGQAFEDMTEDDWEEVKKGAVGRRLEQKHTKLVAASKSKFLENLKSQK